VWDLCSHLLMFNIRCATGQEKKYSPLRAYFLMPCCFICFALAIDTASGFLTGGPVLKVGRVDFVCEALDFEDEATLTMRGMWVKKGPEHS